MRTWFLTIIAGLLLIAPSVQAAEQVVFTSNRTGNTDVFVMSPDGSGQTNITNTPDETEEYPMWNLDGTKIAYTKVSVSTPTSATRDNLYTVKPDGTGLTTTVIGNQPLMPAYVPGGPKISYSRFNVSDWDIYTSSPDGTGKVRLTNNQYGDYYPRWNPTGTKILFYTFDPANGGAAPDIYIANANGSGQVRLTSGYRNQYATWSPDGSKIVFQSTRDGNQEIYTMNPDGTSQTRITNNAADDTVPVYSPDGSKIMFVSNRDGNNEIYTMNVDGSNQTRITNNTYDDNFPTWSPIVDVNAPVISVNDITTAEGVANNRVYNFTAVLTAPSATPVTITYQTYDITATAGSDYVATPPTTVTFAPGQTSKLLPVTVTGDRLNEANETLGIHLMGAGVKFNKQDGIATIPNDDSIPTVRATNLTVPEGQYSNYINVPITLSAPSGQVVTGTYATSNGTATAGSDYVASSGSFRFNPGETTITIPIYVHGDFTLEPDETFYINISNATNAIIGTARGTVTLTDDDKFPFLSISDATTAEGTNATFTVTLSRASSSPIQVKYKTVDDSAVAGSDYSTRTGTLTIAAGQTSGIIAIPTLTDSVVEPTEIFNVVLSDAVNATIVDDTGMGFITNTTLPTIYVSDVTIKEGNSNNRMLYFTVALSDSITFPLTVNYSTEDGTATTGSDYTATSGTITFEAGQASQSVAVPIVADTAFESDETFLLNVIASANGATASANGLATIVNDDADPSAKSSGRTVSGQGY